MNEIETQSTEIETYLRTKKNLLIGSKISFLLLVLFGFFQAYIHILGYRNKFKDTWFEWNIIQFIIFLIFVSPIIVMPLHKFISDRRMNGFIWNIKKSIFETILNKYDTTYKISIRGCLPDSDIALLKLEKGWVSFVYGDDLIIGTINNVKFRLSEMHSNGFIKRHFDGVICVLVFDHLIDSKKLNIQLPDTIEIRHFENKIYLLWKGDKKLFELAIKKRKTNTEKLIEDQTYFKSFMEIINDFSIRLNKK